MQTNLNIEPTRLKNDLNAWLERNKHFRAAAILQYLVMNANQSVHVEFIDHHCYRKRPVENWPDYSEACVFGVVSCLENHYLSDPKTVHDCENEFKRAIREMQICADLGDDYGVEKWRIKARDLKNYVKEVTTPGGGMKRFPAPWIKANNLVNSNIRYMLNIMGKQRPDLAAYVKKHLKRGKWFTWSDTEDEDLQRYSANAHWTLNHW